MTLVVCRFILVLLRPLRVRDLRNASTLLNISGTACTGMEILGVHLRALRNACTLLGISREFSGVVNVRVTKRTLRYASTLLSISGNNAGQ